MKGTSCVVKSWTTLGSANHVSSCVLLVFFFLKHRQFLTRGIRSVVSDRLETRWTQWAAHVSLLGLYLMAGKTKTVLNKRRPSIILSYYPMDVVVWRAAVYVDRERENLVSMSTKTSLCFCFSYFFCVWVVILSICFADESLRDLAGVVLISHPRETPTCKCVACTLSNRSFRLLLAHGTHTGPAVFRYFRIARVGVITNPQVGWDCCNPLCHVYHFFFLILIRTLILLFRFPISLPPEFQTGSSSLHPLPPSLSPLFLQRVVHRFGYFSLLLLYAYVFALVCVCLYSAHLRPMYVILDSSTPAGWAGWPDGSYTVIYVCKCVYLICVVTINYTQGKSWYTESPDGYSLYI